MLSPSDHNKILTAVSGVVDALGVPATWIQTKDPQATADAVVGFKSVSWNDAEMINAYGIGSKIVTVKVVDIPVIEKFDRISVLGEAYTIDAVMPVHLNGVHIFHKCIIKGK